MQRQSTHATRDISPNELQSLASGAGRSQITLDELLLVSFGCMLARLTHQDIVAISLSSDELIQLNLEGGCSFADLISAHDVSAHDPGAKISRKRTLTRVGTVVEQGIRYEFRTDGEAIDEESGCGLRLSVQYPDLSLELVSPAGLWEGPTLRNWLDWLVTMAQAAAQSPATPVALLPLWHMADARDFYQTLNQTYCEFPGESSVPGRFRAQALRRAKCIAVMANGRKYTFRELDERSDSLAKRLVAAGAGPNRAVAVCMERTVDLPMTLLAVLKSGSYYVPLDPQNPNGRLRGILDECKPAALVSDLKVGFTLAGSILPNSLELILVDQLAIESAAAVIEGNFKDMVDAIGLPSEIDPLDLAYTIYTSGTTGRPKGVAIRHESLLNLICSMWRSPGITENDRTLAVAPISFDIATMDMFLPLCSGGTLILASREDAVDPFRLAHLIKEHDITCMQATPATWRMLVTSGWTGKRGLKMISGGEALARELANSLIRLGGELWNCYGPTETTIYSGILRIEEGSGIVPVGPPIANTSFYVADTAGYPVPPGVPGELYIGGIGVSSGYVARPELTAERYVRDQFAAESESSTYKFLFRTGDLVRLVDGKNFEFFGRLDHQVKLRGFRIELGEIEATLRAHRAITDAVVVLREDQPGEPRLVAYVIGVGLPFGSAELREFAAKSLPDYMLPSVIVLVDRYPMSASGKINRRALPIPESVPRQIAADLPEAAAAANDLEARLLHIFQDVLRNDSIGVTDSFFRFGGYSLLTVRLFSKIDKDLKVRLPISMLFDAPTVRELAKVIERGASPPVIVPIRPFGRTAPLFVVQSYLLYNAMLDIVENDRPVYGVREMGEEYEPLTVEDRARKFAREILAVQPNGPLYLAGWCAAGTLTVEIARQLREAGHEVGLVALFDAERPGFALPSGPAYWASRAVQKTAFHIRRISNIPWRERFAYLYEAIERNWDTAVESYYTANYNTMLWLQKHFGLSLSEAAYNNVYASLAAIKDYSVRPYPGKLSLFRAADVPDFAEMDATLGWSEIAIGGVDVNFVPGDHVSMFKKPHIHSLAFRMQEMLQNCEAKLVGR